MTISQLIEEAFCYGFDIASLAKENNEEIINYILEKHQEAKKEQTEVAYFEWLSEKLISGSSFDVPKKEKESASKTRIGVHSGETPFTDMAIFVSCVFVISSMLIALSNFFRWINIY